MFWGFYIFFVLPHLFKSFNADSDKNCFCSGGRVSSGSGGLMKSPGRGWIVLSLPTAAILCLPGLTDFCYCSTRIQCLLEVPMFCYTIQKSLGDYRYLCEPALTQFGWLGLAGSFLFSALSKEYLPPPASQQGHS